jgi:hypothetical protein
MGPNGWGFIEGVGCTIGVIFGLKVIGLVSEKIQARRNAAGGDGNQLGAGGGNQLGAGGGNQGAGGGNQA